MRIILQAKRVTEDICGVRLGFCHLQTPEVLPATKIKKFKLRKTPHKKGF